MPAPLSPLIVRMRHAIEGCRPIQIRGRVTQVAGTLLKAVVPGVRIGELCQLRNPDQSLALLAEVIGFQQHQALLTPLGEMLGVSSNTEVSPTGGMHRVAVGEHLLGQVLDGLGRPFDGSPPAEPAAWYPVYRDAPQPMSRRLIERPLSLGVRAIDGLLTCGEGQRMGIFAAAGGGKSTLCQLLPRFYDVDSGSVSVDGHDVRSLTQRSLRRAIGIVQQDVFLFADTIRENIRYGRPGASDEEVEAAAKRAEIYDDIMAMPDGFDTYVGERGTLLSGGQKQRVSIARIFLKDPPILILDEATSALDSVTEAKIQGAFDELSRGRTTLIIAHRLSTIRAADRILVIQNGRIAEEGSHRQLLALNGAYAKLYRTQDLGGSYGQT